MESWLTDASWITRWDVRALRSGQISAVRQGDTMLLTPEQERGEIRRDRPAEDLAAQRHSVLFGRTARSVALILDTSEAPVVLRLPRHESQST